MAAPYLGVQSNAVPYTTIGIGGSVGDTPYSIKCPNDQVVTGLTVNSGTMVDSIASMQCSRPGDLFNPSKRYTVSGWSTGGTPTSLFCKPGSMISSLGFQWDQNQPLRYMNASCFDAINGKKTDFKGWGSLDTKYSWTPFGGPPYGLSGITGTRGNYIDHGSFTFKDYSLANSVLGTDLGKRMACNNEVPDDFKTMTASECDSFMNTSCKSTVNPNPTKTYTPGDATYSVWSSGVSEPRCSCYNSPIIANFQKQDPMFPNCPHIYDKTCQASGYKSAALKGITNCSYLNCSVNTVQSNLTSSNIQQVCTVNGVQVPSNTPPSSTSSTSAGSTPSNSPPTQPTSNPISSAINSLFGTTSSQTPSSTPQNAQGSAPSTNWLDYVGGPNGLMGLLVILLLIVLFLGARSSSTKGEGVSPSINKTSI